MPAVEVAPVRLMVSAASVSPDVIWGAVHDVYDDDTEKSAATPDELEIIASLDPVVSLTTVAVTPATSLLMALARSAKVSPVFPLPVAMVMAVPPTGVIVMDDVGRVAVELVSKLEYHAPVDATLFTTTVWEPATVPVAAVAVSSLVLEDVTVLLAKGPANEFSDCMSVMTAFVAV